MSGKILFDNRVAIVTGAGGGLGRHYAFELARRGAQVIVNDLEYSRNGDGSNFPSADRVVEEIKAFGGMAVSSNANIATREGGKEIIQVALDSFGRVDILINNAGIVQDRSFANMEEETWDAVIAVHLKGAFCVTQPAFQQMKKQSYGRIVMTTSGSGIFGNAGQANYASAKTGLIGMTNVLKLEGLKYNIKTNLVAPIAGTRLNQDVAPPEVFKKMKVEFVTPVVLYLCSEQCQDSGIIINAGFGQYCRSAILTGHGVRLSDGKRIPTPEDIIENWDKIMGLKKARFFDQLNRALNEFGQLEE